MVSDWVTKEMESCDLGDKRMNDRLEEVLSMMAANP